MKKISIFFATILMSSILMLSCKKVKDGAPGPKGDTGASGVSLFKSGNVTTAVSGINTLGDEFSANNISYQYYKNVDDNIYFKTNYGEGDQSYFIRLKRYDSTGANFFMLEIEVTPDDTLARYIDYKYINTDQDIAFLDGYYWDLPFLDDKVQISDFSFDYVNFTFDNFNFDPATGKISFGFNADYTDNRNSTGNDATVTGNVDLTLKGAALKQGSFE